MNTDSYRLAYRAGQEAARSDFEKNANKIPALAGKMDPRVALLLGAAALPAAAFGGHLLMRGADVGLARQLGVGAMGGLAALGTGIAGAANPGLARQTALLPRLSSEFAAAAQTPSGAAKSLALMLGVPYGLYQLGKKVGENESSIF
tara:strand:- start:4249 stop:4689 length:441 start_codon:yes stop_codon:yes gene_type:complete